MRLISAAIIALIAMALLFASRLLHREDIKLIDWSALGLIAGGIGVGTLLDQIEGNYGNFWCWKELTMEKMKANFFW